MEKIMKSPLFAKRHLFMPWLVNLNANVAGWLSICKIQDASPIRG